MHDDVHPDQPPEPPLQQVQHSAATARVPEAVGRGVFATGVIILTNPHEVVLDFVQGISHPRRVAARVVLSHAVAAQFAVALEGNLAGYAATFGGLPRMPVPQAPHSPAGAGSPPASPKPAGGGPAAESTPPIHQGSDAPAPQRPADAAATTPSAAPGPSPQPISDIYEQIRLPDDMLGGAYANVVSITHTPAEFCFDFIASVYPRSVVTARVYLAASRAADALASLRRSIAPH